MKNDKKKDLALYVHIPFCVQKCFYCDFLSGPASIDDQNRYVDALLSEIRSYRAYAYEYRVRTIFIGGGTPSSIDAQHIERIMKELGKVFRFDPSKDVMEITIEINPGTVNRDKLEMYKRAGINRISFGLQSTNEDELKRLGRIHTYEKFLENYQTAREVGFNNINIDLMSSLPGQSEESYYETLEKVIAIHPEHISAYSLIIEEGTPFYELYGESGKDVEQECHEMLEAVEANESNERNQNRLDAYLQKRTKDALAKNRGFYLPTEEEDRKMYEMTKKIMHKHGYERYEISNYAKKGFECKHNQGYWTRKAYLGIGSGAASCIHEVRFSNVRDLQEYISLADMLDFQAKNYVDYGTYDCEQIEEFKVYELINQSVQSNPLHQEVEILTEEEQMEEFMFLGLRRMAGVDEHEFTKKFGRSMNDVYGKVLGELVEENLLQRNESRIFLTDHGIDISNYVFGQFLLEDNE